MTTLHEKVSTLKAGDRVRASFQELESDNLWSIPTGEIAKVRGTLKTVDWGLGNGPGLSIETTVRRYNRQYVRQGSGAPGGWLVDVEVLSENA